MLYHVDTQLFSYSLTDNAKYYIVDLHVASILDRTSSKSGPGIDRLRMR